MFQECELQLLSVIARLSEFLPILRPLKGTKANKTPEPSAQAMRSRKSRAASIAGARLLRTFVPYGEAADTAYLLEWGEYPYSFMHILLGKLINPPHKQLNNSDVSVLMTPGLACWHKNTVLKTAEFPRRLPYLESTLDHICHSILQICEFHIYK